MNLSKKSKYYLLGLCLSILFLFSFGTLKVSAGTFEDGRNEYTNPKILTESATYKKQLQELHSKVPYKFVRDEDYFQTNGGTVYFPWVLAKDISGYGVKWNNYPGGYVFGPSDSIQEYPFLYLHRITRNLNDNNGLGSHQLKRYGGEDQEVSSDPLTKMPNILANTTYLIYNFVPHIMGGEGTQFYDYHGLVPSNADKMVGVSVDMGPSHKGQETQYFQSFTLPYAPADKSSQKVSLVSRNGLYKVMNFMGGPLRTSNVGLALDEFSFQRNASYDFMTQIPGNRIDWAGVSWVNQGEDFHFNFKPTNHDYVYTSNPDNDHGPWPNIKNIGEEEAGVELDDTGNPITVFNGGGSSVSAGGYYSGGSTGNNWNFKSKGAGDIRYEPDPASVFFNYYTRTFPVKFDIGGTKYVGFDLRRDGGTGSLNNTMIANYNPTMSTAESLPYLGWYRSLGYGSLLETMGNPYIALDVANYETANKESGSLTGATIEWHPWSQTNIDGSKRFYTFDSRLSRLFLNEFGKYTEPASVYQDFYKPGDAQSMKVIQDYKDSVDWARHFAKFNPELVNALLDYTDRDMSSIKAKGLDPNFTTIDTAGMRKLIETNMKAHRNDPSYQMIDALLDESVTAQVANNSFSMPKYSIDFIKMFYSYFAIVTEPSEYSAGVCYTVRRHGNGYNNLSTPAYKDYADLYLLNSETRSGLTNVKIEENAIDSNEQALGEKKGIELYSFDPKTPTESGALIPGGSAGKFELNRLYRLRTYMGFDADTDKARLVKEAPQGEGTAYSYHDNINVSFNLLFSNDGVDLDQQKKIDLTEHNFKNLVPYEGVPMTDITSQRKSITSKIMKNTIGYPGSEPRYKTYEALFKVTKTGIEIYQLDASNTPKWVKTIQAESGSTIDTNKVQSYYFQTFITDEHNNYRGDEEDKSKVMSRYPGTNQLDIDYIINDNNYLNNDMAGFFIGVSDKPDIIVANSKATVNPKIIEWEPNRNFVGMDIIRENGQPLLEGQSVVQGEKLTVKSYVARTESPMDPTGADNAITLKDIQMILSENINKANDSDSSHDTATLTNNANVATSKNMGTIYQRTYDKMSSPTAKLTQYYNPAEPTKGWQKVSDPNTLGGIRFEAGMILEFDEIYTVPRWNDIMNPADPKFDGANWLVGDTRFKSLSLTYDLNIKNTQAPTVNTQTKNDWVKRTMGVDNPGEDRNIEIDHIWVKDETGAIVGEVYKDDDGHIVNDGKVLTLDHTKNYYVETTFKFIYPADTKRSINQDIKAAVVISYNGTPQNDMNSMRYKVSSNDRPGYMMDGETATYSPVGSKYNIDIKNYDATQPKTGDTMIIPLKKSAGINSGAIWIKIPDAYNPKYGGSPNDNCIMGWESQEIDFQTTNEEDNAVTSIDLYDLSGKKYDALNTDSTFSIDPTQRYYAIITVKRLQGSDPSMVKTNPGLDVSYKVSQSATDPYTKRIPSTATLRNVGDKIEYRLDGLYSPDGYIEINAKFNYTDIDMSNNQMSKIWSAVYNFAVSDFIVSPDKLYLQQNQSSIQQSLAFSATITYEAYGEAAKAYGSAVVPKVPVQIKDQYGRALYYEEFDLNNNKPFEIHGYLNNGSPITLQQGNLVLTIAINGGGKNGGFTYRKYIEVAGAANAYDDNTAIANVSVDKAPPAVVLDCTSLRTSNTWSVRYSMFKQTGTMKSRTYTVCGEGGCSQVTVYWCENVVTKSWQEDWNYTETFKINAVWFRSEQTVAQGNSGYINILGNNNGIVRAGQWFEFYVETTYQTNRPSMPATWRNDMCNYQTRSPGLSSVYGNPSYINMTISGYGTGENYAYMAPTSASGPWYSKVSKFQTPPKLDAMGQTYTRRYIPTTGVNGTINIRVQTIPFNGYIYDQNHPKVPLKDCVSATINIKDPLPLNTDTTDVQ